MSDHLEDQFVANLPLVERVVGFVARRHRLSSDETDELASVVKLKLIEDDYAVFRAFEGRSSLQTYLTVVIQRIFLDLRISAWGKWRPSAEARRLGPTAVLLERLTGRDGLGFDEACRVMRFSHRVEATDAELEALQVRLPARVRRRTVGEEELAGAASADRGSDAPLLEQEASRDRARGIAALESALSTLEPDDRLIVKFRFLDGLQVADIARLMARDQKPLYRRIEGILRTLRQQLEARGIRAEDVNWWFEDGAPETAVGRPSLQVTAGAAPARRVGRAR